MTTAVGAVSKRLLSIRSVPPQILVLTALASYGGQVLAGVAGWSLWGIVLATVLPWVLVFTLEITWTYRHFHWLALFYVLVVTQGGHFLEHLTQMVQIHVLDLSGAEARGVFGQLDIEWVHFGWNTWVLLATLVLLFRYRRNAWLWATFVFAGWHEIEHAYLLSQYLATGHPGHPGLLSMGGVVGNGLPLKRPDLHFLYNLVETVPMVVAFGYALKGSYDEWLAQALPHASTELLVATTNRLETRTYHPGDVIVRQGDPAGHFYVVVRGEVGVACKTEDREEVNVAMLGPGQFFGEVGLLNSAPRTATVRAKTPVEVLSLDRESFRQVIEQSEATAEELARVAHERASSTEGQVPR
ncbi:MAG: cyclic nucleotide-binding domain-containing protein [Actinomycetota bacterium]|nr:cyclic nucleotide-binding domain-containing protein [Actinomycetota bacterium]